MVKDNGLVLEVGSGDFPSYFSDVLVDKYPDNNFQRNKNIWIDRRVFIAADANRLPFKDKAFNYVIAANILPYVDNPEVLFKELMRIAPRGVIMAISELYERLRDIEFHKWYVNLVDNKLILKRKDKSNREFGKLFHMLCENDRQFLKFLNKHWVLFNLTCHWEGSINYAVVPPDTRIIDLEDAEQVEKILKDKRGKIVRILNSILSSEFKNFVLGNIIKIKRLKRGRKKIDLSSLLICPQCRNDIIIKEDNIRCLYCGKVYPIKNGIPYMIVD